MAISWDIVSLNICEAREELERIESLIAAGTPPDEEDFQICMQHAFHHLNVAWNARHESIDRYANLSQDDYERWGQFPHDLAFGD